MRNSCSAAANVPSSNESLCNQSIESIKKLINCLIALRSDKFTGGWLLDGGGGPFAPNSNNYAIWQSVPVIEKIGNFLKPEESYDMVSAKIAIDRIIARLSICEFEKEFIEGISEEIVVKFVEAYPSKNQYFLSQYTAACMTLLNLQASCFSNQLKDILVQQLDKENIKTEKTSLNSYLENNGLTSSRIHDIQEYLIKILQYTQEELSDVYKLLSTHGRLFLNNLLIAYQKDGKKDDGKKKFSHLSSVLEKIEVTSPPLAHFIWVGPPNASKNELAGIRSLKKAMCEQKVYFWVLDDYVEQYKKLLNELGISKKIEIISIEKYSEKIQASVNNFPNTKKELKLVEQIEHLKLLSKRKEGVDAIRDRVTIVDYIKSLIAYFEGGYIFDADIILCQKDHQSQKKTLSALPTWTFPVVGNNSYDVWFFYCEKTYNWNGEQEKKPEDEFVIQDVANLRATFLHYYHKHVVTAYKERGENPLSEEFCSKLGEIVEIGGGNIFTRRAYGVSSDQKMQLATIHGLHINHIKDADYSIHCCRDEKHGVMIELFSLNEKRCSLFNLSIPGQIDVVKFMNQSYAPGEKKSLLHADLLYTDDAVVFKKGLALRGELTNFDITHCFDTAIVLRGPDYFCAFIPQGRYKLEKVTMLHLALLARQDLFLSVLAEIPLDKIEQVMTMKVKVARDLFFSENERPGQVQKTSGENDEKMKEYEIPSLIDQLKKQFSRHQKFLEKLENFEIAIQRARAAAAAYRYSEISKDSVKGFCGPGFG